MRLIDADRLLSFIEYDAQIIVPEEHTAEDIIAMIKTAPTIKPPPNTPLTLEELREMDGEPVWIEQERGGQYRIIDSCIGYFTDFLDGGYLRNTGYGDTWTAYRHKPGGD